MSQAILMMAHKNVEQINDIISFLGEHFEYYIHIDKKSKLDVSRLTKQLNIHVFSVYSVNWGGLNQVRTELLLSKEALSNKKLTFFHLISAEDFPTKPVEYFFDELDTEKDYISYEEMPRSCWSDNGGLDRLQYYNFLDALDVRGSKNDETLYWEFVKVQKNCKLKRKLPHHIFPKLYGGSNWWSLTRETLQYVIDFTDTQEDALSSMEYTRSADEIYFQSVILNSSLQNNIRGNLRYIDWKSGRGGYPAFLDETDYEKIIKSNHLFARKFDINSSDRLKRLLIATYGKKNTLACEL